MKESNTGRASIWRAGRFTWDLSEKGLIMGILNVTPDSFSDGGSYETLEKAVQHARGMIADGADILDIGGESTRPGSLPVTLKEELSRTIPVIEMLRLETEVAISIDTSKPEVARAALDAGADIVNDVTGFRDLQMRSLCAHSSCGMVAMHMQGSPKTMQNSPDYKDVVAEVSAYFEKLLHNLDQEGIASNRVILDPGVGFGKSLDHNIALLRGIPALCDLGRPLLLGASRKSLIGDLLGSQNLNDREHPTVALTAFALSQGAMIHRVHSVQPNTEVEQLIRAISER